MVWRHVLRPENSGSTAGFLIAISAECLTPAVREAIAAILTVAIETVSRPLYRASLHAIQFDF
jgi:hypothetical protein